MTGDSSVTFATEWSAISNTIHRSFGRGESRSHESISVGTARVGDIRRIFLEVRRNAEPVFATHIDPKAARHLARAIFAAFPEDQS